MQKIDELFEHAALRKGGHSVLNSLLTQPKTQAELINLGDDRLLAEMTKKIFQSGFVWRVVSQKWPNFEEVFFEFNIEKILMMPDEMLERKASDPAIIRNYNKVKTIRENALMLHSLAEEFGSAAKWLADWPSDDVTGLWAYLKKEGSRLGGNTGAYALRILGKDTFILSKDVEAYFRSHKLIEGGLSSKRNLAIIQNAFNAWQQQSDFSLQEISQIIAYGNGDNYVGIDA